MHISKKVTLPAATALAIILSSPAFALDGADLIAKMNGVYAAQGGSLTAEETSVDGDTVVAKGVTLSPNGDADTDLPLGEVTFADVEEDNGGYKVGTVTFDDINVSEKGTTISISDIEISGLTVPASAEAGTINSVMLFEQFKTGEINVGQDGKDVGKAQSVVFNMDAADDMSNVSFTGKVNDITADLTTVPDPKAKATIDALDLQNIAGEISMAGAWEVASGKIELSEYALDFQDIGKLNLTFGMTGYTLEFMKALQEAQAAMAANPDKQAANQAFGMTMMGLMQQLSFSGASIRFDDDSITQRVLDFVGQQQGVSGDQMAQSLKGMLPLMLARMNMPELQAQITEAAGKFLDDPQSIEIKAAPSQPVPAPTIMGAAMGAPQTIPQVLGVTVTANQ